MSRRKRLLFFLVMFALVFAFSEGFSWAAIALMPHWEIRRTGDIYADQSNQIRHLLATDGPPVVIEIHPVLGWRYAPNYKGPNDQLNSKALRSAREYTPTPGPKVLRVAAFGSSIVYCSEVDNANAWPALMETGQPDLEVLNYGVPGYGPDQAYLRYLAEGRDLAPHVVLLGFTSDELRRTLNVYRRFLSTRDVPLFKPRFQIDDQGELTLLPPPVRDRAGYERVLADPREIIAIGKQDHWYRPSVYENPLYDYSAAVRLGCWVTTEVNRRYVDPDRISRGQVFRDTSTAYRIQMAVFAKFAEAVRASGAIPLIVFLPEKESVHRALQGGPKFYDPLLADLRQRGIDSLDTIEAFQAAGATADVPTWYASGGHYSAAGNKVLASWLPAEIRKKIASQNQTGIRAR